METPAPTLLWVELAPSTSLWQLFTLQVLAGPKQSRMHPQSYMLTTTTAKHLANAHVKVWRKWQDTEGFSVESSDLSNRYGARCDGGFRKCMLRHHQSSQFPPSGSVLWPEIPQGGRRPPGVHSRSFRFARKHPHSSCVRPSALDPPL